MDTTKHIITKHRYICDLLWKTAFDYLKSTDQERSLLNLSYYWGTLFFSIHNILDKNLLNENIKKEFVHSASDLFKIPLDDVETLAALKGVQKTAYQALVDSGLTPSSKESLYLSLELAGFLDNPEDDDLVSDVNPQHLAEYVMSVADLTKEVSSYLSRPAEVPIPVTKSSLSSTAAETARADLWEKKLWVILVVIVAVLFLIIVFSDSDGGDSSPTFSTSYSSSNNKQTDAATEETLVAKTRPWSGRILQYPSTDRVAPLTIKTSSLSDYYIFLKHTSVKSMSMAFYVQGGTSIDIEVPLGEYEIYYATGYTWYGLENLFGSDTMYYKCEDTFPFTYSSNTYNGWTLTLYAVSNGNMDTELINAADFPK